MDSRVSALIARFGLTPLPAEGTLFASTYRSVAETDDGAPIGTAIVAMYCDDPRSVSRFHRLPADEIWHFYSGDPFRLVLLHPDGTSREVIMGPDPLAGHEVQVVIPAGVWHAGHLLPGGSHALFGCTMAPGFTSSMFEGGSRDGLLPLYPDRRDDIAILACDDDDTAMPPDFAT